MKKKKMTTGAFPAPSRDDVRALRERHDLTHAQFAKLCRAAVQYSETQGGWRSSSAQRWERVDHSMPASTYELIYTKLWLVDKGLTLIEELNTKPLHRILDALLKRS